MAARTDPNAGIKFTQNATFQNAATLLTGDFIGCPGPDPRCIASPNAQGYPYVLQPSDETGEVLSPPACPFDLNNPGGAHRVAYFFIRGTGQSRSTGAGVQAASACNTIAIDILHPCIGVTKNCVLPAGGCYAYGAPVTISGTVTNCGNTKLFNVSLSDAPPATITFGQVTGGAAGPHAFDGTLDVTESVTYTGTYTPANLCGPHNDTITATGSDVLGGAVGTVTATASASCPVCTNPNATITYDCVDATANGAPINFTGTVRNTGDVPLNVTSLTTVLGTLTPSTPLPTQLAIGGTLNYSGSYTLAPNQCDPVPNTVTVTASGICPQQSTPFTRSASESCRQPCRPDITVDKTVACAPPPPAVCDGSLPYADTATGIQGAAFCYKITVCNPASAPEALNNLQVFDSDLGVGPLPGFPSTLAIGQCATAYFKKTWPVSGNIATFVNTVEARGVGSNSGVFTNDFDDATVRLLPIGVECDITLSSSMDAGGPCDIDLPDGTVDAPITFTLVLTNTGQAAINVTALNGLPALVDCDTRVPIVPVYPISLAVGESKTIVGCVIVSCPGGAEYSVSAHAEVDDQGGAICVYKSDGTKISTDSAACTARVCCIPIVEVDCRVTGGGVLIPGFVDQSCIEVATTIFPFTSPNGLTIKKITHGGQLGAPFSQMDCGAVLGNPCIRGQWSHTRHYEGQANPRDVFDMNFHSQTPKGTYDSLSCACLGCCDPGTGVFIPPTEGPLVHKFKICNPDDHKVCGPQPRPAPANVIIWSGIGRITPTDDVRGSRAAQAEWVIYRIYIEDRSEPGGGHPKGAVEPADIYCFQAWKTGIKTSKKPDFSNISVAFRTALGEANCQFLEDLENGVHPIGTLPSPTVMGATADIQDCGPMHDGNHQIHPATGATCTQ